jgi:hypothetical protein
MTDYPEERSALGRGAATSVGERHLILSGAIDLIEVDLAAGVCRVVKGGLRGSVNAEGTHAHALLGTPCCRRSLRPGDICLSKVVSEPPSQLLLSAVATAG